MAGTAYASGKHALGICKRCGFQVRYRALRREPDTGLQVCGSCLDEPNPYKHLKPRVDPVALRNPSPESEDYEVMGETPSLPVGGEDY